MNGLPSNARMQHILRRPWESQKLRYLATGGFNTLAGYGEFALLYYLMTPALPYAVPWLLANILGITTSFLTYKFFVFRTHGRYLREYLRFYVVYGIPALPGLGLFALGVGKLHWNAYAVHAVIMFLTVIVSYFGHKHFSFRR